MREREERILGDHMVLVGKEGDQLSLTEFKGGGGARQKIGCQSTINEWGRGVGGIITEPYWGSGKCYRDKTKIL